MYVFQPIRCHLFFSGDTLSFHDIFPDDPPKYMIHKTAAVIWSKTYYTATGTVKPKYKSRPSVRRKEKGNSHVRRQQMSEFRPLGAALVLPICREQKLPTAVLYVYYFV